MLGSEQQATFIELCILEPNHVGLDVLVILAREGMHSERGATLGYTGAHAHIYKPPFVFRLSTHLWPSGPSLQPEPQALSTLARTG